MTPELQVNWPLNYNETHCNRAISNTGNTLAVERHISLETLSRRLEDIRRRGLTTALIRTKKETGSFSTLNTRA